MGGGSQCSQGQHTPHQVVPFIQMSETSRMWFSQWWQSFSQPSGNMWSCLMITLRIGHFDICVPFIGKNKTHGWTRCQVLRKYTLCFICGTVKLQRKKHSWKQRIGPNSLKAKIQIFSQLYNFWTHWFRDLNSESFLWLCLFFFFCRSCFPQFSILWSCLRVHLVHVSLFNSM